MQPPPNQGARFVVDLGDARLPPEYTERMARAIQRAVLQELAALDLSEKAEISFPKEWIGFLARLPEDVGLRQNDSMGR
jgi:hypothetical protein